MLTSSLEVYESAAAGHGPATQPSTSTSSSTSSSLSPVEGNENSAGFDSDSETEQPFYTPVSTPSSHLLPSLRSTTASAVKPLTPATSAAANNNNNNNWNSLKVRSAIPRHVVRSKAASPSTTTPFKASQLHIVTNTSPTPPQKNSDEESRKSLNDSELLLADLNDAADSSVDVILSEVAPPSTLLSLDPNTDDSVMVGMGLLHGPVFYSDFDSDGLIVNKETEVLQTTITSLRRRLHDTRKSYEQAAVTNEERINSLMDEVENLRIRSKSRTDSIHSFSSSLGSGGEKRRKAKAAVDEVEQLELEVERLTKELADSRSHSLKLRNQLDRRSEGASKLKEELDQKEIACASMEYQLQILEKEMKKKTEESTALTAIVKSLKTELTTARNINKELTEENQSLNETVAQLNTNMKEIMTMMNVEEDEEKSFDSDGASFMSARLENSKSLYHELKSHLPCTSNILDSSSFFNQLAKNATTRESSSQTDAAPTTTSSSTQSISPEFHSQSTETISTQPKTATTTSQTDFVTPTSTTATDPIPQTLYTASTSTETIPSVSTTTSTQTTEPTQKTSSSTDPMPSSIYTHQKSTETLSIETTSLGIQSVAHTRDSGCQSSPTSTASIATSTLRVETVDEGCQPDATTPPATAGIQTDSLACMDVSVETDVLPVLCVGVQTVGPMLSDSGDMAVLCVDGVRRKDGVCQTLCVELSETGSVLFEVEGVRRRDAGVQVGAGVQCGKGVQTDAVGCVSQAFGVVMETRGVSTELGMSDVEELVAKEEELRRVCDGFEGVEAVWRQEVEVLEECCLVLRKALEECRKDVLENRRQLNLRRHYDGEVERWIGEVRREVNEVESVIEPAREALEKRLGLENTLMERVAALVELKKEYEESIQRMEEAKIADEEEKRQHHMFDMSLMTLSSQVMNDPIPAEEWSDIDDELNVPAKTSKKSSVKSVVKFQQSRSRDVPLISMQTAATAVIIPLAVTLCFLYLQSSDSKSSKSLTSASSDVYGSATLGRKGGMSQTESWMQTLDQGMAFVEGLFTGGDTVASDKRSVKRMPM
ncbi:hypothetical protein HDU79_008149 [Rhizoclosmatium sp. JEL0117]|nr:hypothetical protein HDU79_008149 [Rhizoclosmatium sp. JEL0117]